MITCILYRIGEGNLYPLENPKGVLPIVRYPELGITHNLSQGDFCIAGQFVELAM
jgi:hypothetical protein